jgi:Fe-S cluster assembly scaffold protein SufB
MATTDLDLGKYKLGWSDVEDYVFKPRKGLSEEIVREMSAMKGEPDWMLQFRLKALKRFMAKPMLPWFADKMPGLDFDDIYYYIKPTDKQVNSWDQLPDSVKSTWDRLGIPEAEKKYLAGVTAQYECLRGSTRVWTTSGMRAIKELGPGDEVLSLDEGSKQIVTAPVVAQRCSGEKEVFELRARGQVIGASANHPFLVLRDERRPGRKRRRHAARWLAMEQLLPGDLVAIATDTPDFGERATLRHPARTSASPLPNVTSEDFCWWAGVYLGGGCVHQDLSSSAVEIAIGPRDTELVAEIVRVTRSLFGITLAVASDGLRLTGRGTADLADFIDLNGLGGTAHSKRVPPWVYGLPRPQRLAFLSGLLGAEGYVGSAATTDAMFTSADGSLPSTSADGSLPSTSADESLLSDVRELVELCGIAAKGTTLRANTIGMLGFVRVDSIEPVGVEPVYDIEVAGHHNFVAEGFVVHNSEVVYHRNREDLERQGVLFMDMDSAVREQPEIVRKWFGRIIPPNDNKFAALNSAVWSGGSFIYVPPGVNVQMPLQAYFRINAENMGQFERTLIIADEGAQVHYVEGCSAPVYSTDSLHSAVVELVALQGGRITYTTIQNWSNNVYNLVTKRARAEAEAHVEWIDGNIGCLAQGSKVTTRSGPKPIELLVPGEEVLSFDEASGKLCFRTVKAKRFSGYQAVREVSLGSRRLHVTDNHPFYSRRDDAERAMRPGGDDLCYVRADELHEAIVPVTSLDYGHPHKLRRSETMTAFGGAGPCAGSFEDTRARSARLEETTDELMWMFGLFVGGGPIERAPAENGGDERRDEVTGRWSSAELGELLELDGFVTGDAKRVPAWVLELPESQRLSFVAGCLDSGGYATARRGELSIESVDRDLLEDVADVLTSLGIPSRLLGEQAEQDGEHRAPISGRAPDVRGSNRLELRADGRLLALVSDPLRRAVLARPQPEPPALRRAGRRHVLPDSVEIHEVEVGERGPVVPTWDIEVEGTGNFVAEGFIVHNSRLTMKYPSVYLMGPKASGEVLSVAYAGEGQHQDTGAKMFHVAPETTSTIVSKSISKDGGTTTYRGKVHVDPGAEHAKSFVRCDALMLDERSTSYTKPYMEVEERDAQIGHEATVSKVGEDQLFYLMSRGLSEAQATSMIVNGFIEPITRTLPMEYAVEWSRLIELQMEGAVG